MRRELVVAALLLTVAALGFSATASADPKKKISSGCQKGAHLGKVLITVEKNSEGKCRIAEVTPASVCVAPNGVIRWQVKVEHNDCEIGSATEPAIQITEPQRKNYQDPPESDPDEPEADRGRVLDPCDRLFVRITQAGPNVRFCDVFENAKDGFYKYDLKSPQLGDVDPDIEVRRPRAP